MKKKYISALPTKHSTSKRIFVKKNGLDHQGKSLQEIFFDDSSDEESFLGFELDLRCIFDTDSDLDEEFLGFNNSKNLHSIFYSDSDSEEEFSGFR